MSGMDFANEDVSGLVSEGSTELVADLGDTLGHNHIMVGLMGFAWEGGVTQPNA